MQIGQGVGLEHRHTLLRRPGHHDNGLALRLKGAAWGRAPAVVEHGAALRQHALAVVVLGEDPALTYKVPEPVHLLPVRHQLKAEGLGQDLLCEIVAGGAQAPGGDDDVRPLLGSLHALSQPLGIVPHHRVV